MEKEVENWDSTLCTRTIRNDIVYRDTDDQSAFEFHIAPGMFS